MPDKPPHLSGARMLLFWTPSCLSFTSYWYYVRMYLNEGSCVGSSLVAGGLGLVLGSVVVGFTATLDTRSEGLGWFGKVYSVIDLLRMVGYSVTCCHVTCRALGELYRNSWVAPTGMAATIVLSVTVCLSGQLHRIHQNLAVPIWTAVLIIYISFALDMHSVGVDPFVCAHAREQRSPGIMFSLCFFTVTRWAAFARDYYNVPKQRVKTFAVTTVGVFVPSAVVFSLSILTVGMVYQHNGYAEGRLYYYEFTKHTIPGLLLRPVGGQRWVLAALIVAVQMLANSLYLYSIAKTVRSLHRHFYGISQRTLVLLASLSGLLCLIEPREMCFALDSTTGFWTLVCATVVAEERALFRGTGSGTAAAVTFVAGGFGGLTAVLQANRDGKTPVRKEYLVIVGSFVTTLVVYPAVKVIGMGLTWIWGKLGAKTIRVAEQQNPHC